MMGLGRRGEPFGPDLAGKPANRKRTYFQKSCMGRLTRRGALRLHIA